MTKTDLSTYVGTLGNELFKLSDSIWDHPEIAFHETYAMDALCGFLEEHGFLIEKGTCALPTAFRAVYGSGKPVIGFLAEYDALDGMSQKAYSGKESPERAPVPGERYGHGCGHHGLGAAACTGAVGAAEFLKEKNLPGTVIVYGCPAEEGGGGKAFLVRDGAFEGTDCCLTWHPSDINELFTGTCLANISATFRFTGVSAHAAQMAYMGRSALDAVELMDVGANYLREHIVPDARIHYAITDTGGTSPNVVQSHAAVYYYVRAPKTWQIKEIYERVCNIAKGAALMTGTEVDVTYHRGINSYQPNTVMDDVLYQNMVHVPLPEYDSADLQLAEKIRETLKNPDETFEEMLLQMTPAEKNKVKDKRGETIYRFIRPRQAGEPLLFGSTDVGDVSMVCPVAQLHAAAYAAGTTLHSWQAVAQGKSDIYHKGELYAAKVLALTAADLFTDPSIIGRADKERTERLRKHPFESLMPDWVKPQFDR